jgi:hypothetical protein
MPCRENPHSRIGRTKEYPATRVSSFIRLHQRQTRRGPWGVDREPAATADEPPVPPAAAIGTALPAWPAAARDLWLPQWKGNAETAPASKETTANVQLAATANNLRAWKNHLDVAPSGATIICPA